jgi:hypothetical protein
MGARASARLTWLRVPEISSSNTVTASAGNVHGSRDLVANEAPRLCSDILSRIRWETNIKSIVGDGVQKVQVEHPPVLTIPAA